MRERVALVARNESDGTCQAAKTVCQNCAGSNSGGGSAAPTAGARRGQTVDLPHVTQALQIPVAVVVAAARSLTNSTSAVG